MKQVIDLNKTDIDVTEVSDDGFTLEGGWHGDQDEAMAMIEAIDGVITYTVRLYDLDGHQAKDNTFQGCWTADLR